MTKAQYNPNDAIAYHDILLQARRMRAEATRVAFARFGRWVTNRRTALTQALRLSSGARPSHG